MTALMPLLTSATRVSQATSVEGPHWMRTDGSWGCMEVSPASGCTAKPDPAEAKVPARAVAVLDACVELSWWQDEKAVVHLRNKEIGEKAHIASLQAQTASTLEHLEHAKAKAQQHKAQGESYNTITLAEKVSLSARGLDCDCGGSLSDTGGGVTITI